MLKLYAFATPNNLKPVIMLEELGLEYELMLVNIRQGEQKTEEFLTINPNAKVPVLIDPDGGVGEFVLTESAAILVYLADRYGKFIPANIEDKAHVLEQLFFHASGIGPAFGNSGFFQKLASEKIPLAIERFHGEAKRLTGLLDKILAHREYVASNEYTIADIAHFGWMWRSSFAGIDLIEFPHVNRWFDQVSVRPAVKKAILKLETLVTSAA